MKKLMVSAAAAMLLATAAQAGPIVGTGSAATLGVSGNPAGFINVGTTFSFRATGWSGGNGDLSGVPFMSGGNIVTSPITATVGSAVSFTADWGSFSGTVQTTALRTPLVNQRVVDVFALGTFTPLVGPPDLSMFDPGPMSLTFSATQTGPANAEISASYTIASPPVGIPEPMTLALVGAGLLGAGAAARRKAKTV